MSKVSHRLKEERKTKVFSSRKEGVPRKRRNIREKEWARCWRMALLTLP